MPEKETPAKTQKQPSVADLLERAKSATQAASDLQASMDAAKSDARAAYDAFYDELVKLKAEAKDMDTFKSSKLGKLLENIREALR